MLHAPRSVKSQTSQSVPVDHSREGNGIDGIFRLHGLPEKWLRFPQMLLYPGSGMDHGDNHILSAGLLQDGLSQQIKVVVGDRVGDQQQVQPGYFAAYTDGFLLAEQENFFNGETAGKDADYGFVRRVGLGSGRRFWDVVRIFHLLYLKITKG